MKHTIFIIILVFVTVINGQWECTRLCNSYSNAHKGCEPDDQSCKQDFIRKFQERNTAKCRCEYLDQFINSRAVEDEYEDTDEYTERTGGRDCSSFCDSQVQNFQQCRDLSCRNHAINEYGIYKGDCMCDYMETLSARLRSRSGRIN
jgi:hypothetical protein